MKTIDLIFLRERFRSFCRLSLITMGVLAGGMGMAQTQLSHWPLFQSTFAEIEIDFTGSATVLMPPGYPATTDKNNIPLTQYRAMNAFHDNQGNLIFYVICDDTDTYVYDAGGTKLMDMASFNNHVPDASSSEIGIVPIPNSCLSGFHVLVGGQILVVNLSTNEIWNGGSSPWRYSNGVRLNPAGGGGSANPVYDYPMAVSRVSDDGYTVYSVEANAIGSTGRYVKRRDVSFCQSGGIGLGMPISNNTFRDITLPGGGLPQSSFYEYVSEMEVSPDGSYMAFADNNHIYVLGIDNTTGNPSTFGNPPVSGKKYTFPNSGGTPAYRVGGLEFSSNNELVFSYFDRTTIGSTAGGVGVWDFLNQPLASLIPNTSKYGRSQIELGRDGKLYVTGPNALDVVNINTLSVNSTGILAGALVLNEPVMPSTGFDNRIRTLPDQIDGYNYVDFINNPNFSYQGTVYDPTVCYGSTTELVPSFGYCYNYGSLSWNFPVTSPHPGHFETDPLYQDITLTASFTNDFGCTVTEEFFIDVADPPAINTQVVNVCEGGSAILSIQCNSGSVEWLSPPSMIGSSVTGLFIITDVVQDQHYVYRCVDQKGCEVARHTTHIYVSDLPELDATVVPICEGQIVNLDDYLPAGFSCGWANDQDGLPLADPHVSPSQGTAYTATCVNSLGCTVYKQVYVDVQPAEVLPYFTWEVCEGEFIDHTMLIPSHWSLKEINVNGSSQVYRYASYDANGCITYHDVTINSIPKTVHTVTISANCGEVIDLNDYNEICTGYAMDWVVAATQLNVDDPVQTISESIEYTGLVYISGWGCCEVNVIVEVPEHDILEAEVCMGGLPPFPCLTDGNSEWFKDGSPYYNTYFNGPGQYRILCKDPEGCVFKEYLFHVPDGETPVCLQQWYCYDEIMGTSLPSPCTAEETVTWFKNGNPYPMDGDFSIMPDGEGSYVAYCINDEGNTVIHRYEIYDCGRFYKNSPTNPEAKEAGLPDKNTEALNIFPNPSEDMIYLTVDGETTQNSATIWIRDNAGRLVKQFTMNPGQTELTMDLSDYAKGIYFVTYKSHRKVISKRIELL